MNDILNDISTLKKVTRIIESQVPYSMAVSTVLVQLRKLISDKEEQVVAFEKTAPSHIQELCNNLRGDK